MFNLLNRAAKKKRRSTNVSRSNRQFTAGRSLHMETLEDRRVLTLLGVAPLAAPLMTFNVDGAVNYDAVSDAFLVDATPISIDSSVSPFGFFFSGDLDINIEVDSTGTLVGGSVGDDFALIGDVDLNGDFVVDASGSLLTGEILAFGHQDSGGLTDNYDFRFQITGGLLTTGALAADYLGKDIGITATSENSTFTGDFNVNFSGNVKGTVGTIDPIPSNPAIDIEKLTNGVNADDPMDAPAVNPGDVVTFTYMVQNTGDVAFDFADVVIVDDNGTPSDLLDDFSTTSGDITLLAASDVGGDLILSPGETWQYEHSTVALDLEAGLSDLVPDGTYQLGNHPDGNAGPPTYGLRLDGLTTGNGSDIFTFSFDQADGADVKMVVDGGEITISGTVFGGRVVSNAYVVGESGLWDLSFTYNGAGLVAGDDDLQVDDLLAGTNTGTITKLFGDLATHDLVDYAGSHDFAFQLGNEADDLGHRGFAGISGWGWMNHAPTSDPAWLDHHLAASDWLFTGELISQPIYKNTAVVTAPDATDMDMSHYTNPDIPVQLDPPHISYNVDGSVSYDSLTDIFTLDATPTTITSASNPFGFFFDGDLDINIIVDDTGSLVAGTAGDDFVLVGDVDLNGDFVVDLSGVLLTGEIIEFSSADSGATTDNYSFLFTVTGGLLAPQYSGQDLKIETTSENSTFTGDFTTNFNGNAKGSLWPMASQADVRASVGNFVFVDNNADGIQNTGDQGINGITVNLLNDQNMVVASTVTDFDGFGNAGFYLFYNLAAGDYLIEFEVPENVTFTTQDAGLDDTHDSDVNVATGQTGVITLADGQHRRDVDAGVLATVTEETTVYSVENYVNRHQNKRAGKVKSLDMQYSAELDELYVSVDFKAYRGRLTDGFTIVITGGEWPAGTEDKFAIFYFDADIRHRHGGPVLNVFGYNGKYNAKSFRDSDGNRRTYDPDRIATSMDNSTGWVKDLVVDTYRVNGRWHRTMSFRIVASAVNSHTNLAGTDWEGAQFGSMTSFAIDTYDGLYTKYNGDGFLKKWKYRRHGWMDGDWVHTTQQVVETQVPIEEFFNEFGWVVTDYVEGSSDGDPPVDENDTISDFDWAGSVDAAMEDIFV